MRYLSIDLETTGLNPFDSDILQIAVVLEDSEKDVPLEDLPSLVFYCYNKKIRGDLKAIQMNSKLISEILEKWEGIKTNDVTQRGYHELHDENEDTHFEYIGKMPTFTHLLEKFIGKYYVAPTSTKLNIAGKNPIFDLSFLIEKTNFKMKFRNHHRLIDPAFYYSRSSDEHLPNLQSCLYRAGFKSEVQHEALSDALDVIKLIRYRFLS